MSITLEDVMENHLTLFITTFTTLLAVINPLEALPVYLGLLEGQDDQVHRRVARLSCLYAAGLMFFFLVFGTLTLRIFSVPLSMVRIVGGIILMRIGFSLFLPDQGSGTSLTHGGSPGNIDSVAFVPLAMPLMFGPGVLATIIGMSSLVRHAAAHYFAPLGISLAIVATMAVTYLILVYAKFLNKYLGPQGIDAATRLVGFFVAAIGMGLIFHGVVEALQMYHIITMR
jgi:multiple antibiotic resistance protein